MNKMIIVRGLPGSGKSYFVDTLVGYLDDSFVVISSDDNITDRYGYYLFNREYLGLSHKLSQLKCEEACKQSIRTIIIDNTNTTFKEMKPYIELAKKYNYEIELKVTETSWAFDVEECYKRNYHSVSKDVIQTMKNRFQSNDKVYNLINTVSLEPDIQKVELDEDLPYCIIVDLDGTLANHEGIRGPFEFDKCDQDRIVPAVKDIIRVYNNDNIFSTTDNDRIHIFLMSGRDSICRDKTVNWLKKYDIQYDNLFMRPEGDFRRDSIIKLELFDKHVRGQYNVLFVIDDRLQVIRECWNKLGVFVLNVNQELKEF